MNRLPHFFSYRTSDTILFSLVVLFTFLLLPVAPSFADLVFEEKTVISGGPPGPGPAQSATRTRVSTTYIKGKKLRSESDKHTYVMDFEKGMMITLNEAKKTYTEMSLSKLREAQEQAQKWMDDLRKQMATQLAQMPPESREAMRKKMADLPQGVMDDAKPVQITVRATGKKMKINGFPCKEYDVFENGEKSSVYWSTKKVKIDAFDEYQKQMGKWMQGMGPLATNRLAEWEKIRSKGFPIKVTQIKPALGKLTFDREILSVEQKSLDESLFQPPADYKLAKTPAMPKFTPPPINMKKGPMGMGGLPMMKGMPPAGMQQTPGTAPAKPSENTEKK